MATQDRVIAGVLTIHSLLGAVWTYFVAAQLGFPSFFLTTNFALVAIGLAAGIGCFKKLRWAALLGLLFFAVQLLNIITPSFRLYIITPSFRLSFSLGLNVTISLGWFGSGQVGINLFALAMLIWISFRVCAPNNSLKRALSPHL